MLMLSRSQGKAIVIGGNIRVTVAQVHGNQVRLGIEAPHGVIVDREEIHRRRIADAEAAHDASFCIDEQVRLVADARRYRFLRDRTCIEDVDTDLLVVGGDVHFTGEELDREIDTAMRLGSVQQLEQQP